jgi:hypothetical protein
MAILIILGIILVLIIAHSFDSASYEERVRNTYYEPVSVKKLGKKKKIITIKDDKKRKQ